MLEIVQWAIEVTAFFKDKYIDVYADKIYIWRGVAYEPLWGTL